MSQSLFDRSIDFNGQAYRNVISLIESQALFDDLTDDPEDWAVANEADSYSKRDMQSQTPAVIKRGYAYTQAIRYPFVQDPTLFTRYGDGCHGVWYGSLDVETTIYEAVFHQLRFYRAGGIDEVITIECAIWKLLCQAVLINLTKKANWFPGLVADDYEFTQPIGRRLHREGHPGLMEPSARCDGVNLAIFNPEVLSKPEQVSFLVYVCDPVSMSAEVKKADGSDFMRVDGRRWA